MRRALVLAAALIVALAGCDNGTKASKVATSTVAPTTTLAPGPAADAELAGKLVSAVPTGFALQPDRPGLTGPIDLAKAGRDEGTPDGQAALQSAGFERGYLRLWANPAGEKILVYVYQHATPEGAQQYFDRSKGMAATRAPAGSQPLVVPGMPPSSIGLSGTQDGTTLALVLFRTGRYVVQVICDGKVPAEVQARVPPVALDQLLRLA